MDSQETDESQAVRKTPIDQLSREDLVKKYRQAILIAQKAKESKAEYFRHLSEHEKVIKNLEEKLQQAKEEKEKLLMESNGGRKEEPPSSGIENYRIENSKLLSELEASKDTVKALELRLSSMKNDFDKIIGVKDQLEKSLIAKENEVKSLKIIKNEENLIWKKNNEELTSKILKLEDFIGNEKRQYNEQYAGLLSQIESLQEQLLNNDEVMKRQETQIAGVESQLEKSKKQLDEKEILLDSAKEEIVELTSQLQELQKISHEQFSDTINELTFENSKLKDDVSKRDEEIRLKEDSNTHLSLEIQDAKNNFNHLKQTSSAELEALKEKEEVINKMLSEFSSKIDQLQLENTNCSQKVAALETENVSLSDQLRENLEELKKQEELICDSRYQFEKVKIELSEKTELLKIKDDAITQLESKVTELTSAFSEQANDNIVKELSDLKTCLEQKILQKDKEISLKDETINCLNRDLQEFKAQEDIISESKNQLEEARNELAEKLGLLKCSEHSITDLKSKVAELTTALSERANDDTVKELLDFKTNLEQKFLLKDEQIHEKDEALACLSTDLKDLEEQVKLSRTMLTESSNKIDVFRSENECYLDKLNSTVKEKEDLISKLREANNKLEDRDKEISHIQSKLTAASNIQQELRDQLNTMQETLQHKESALQELDQEVSKLREAAANECTNTEVSSTFSLSRAEEQSRLRDLEDSFEDKYTKLRVVAVKLKKRVTELNQVLETERSKMASEKSELQAKISQLASHAKSVPTLQSEVDRLQDLLEEQKKTQHQLNKDLESAARDAASTKSELASLQEELHRITNEKRCLEATKENLETALSRTGALSSETERLCKELKQKDLMLETFKEEKQKLAEQLEKVCVDVKKKSVLSLEMADMEKSVSELTRQLSSERNRLRSTEDDLEKERSLLLDLQDKLKKYEDEIKEKDNAIQQLKDVLTSAKEENDTSKKRLKEKEVTIEQLSSQLEKQRSLVEELNIQCSDLASKQMQTKENSRLHIETLSRQVFQLEEQSSSLQDSNKALEDELNSVRTEFENYKVRAQSVLRQSTKQEDRAISSSTVHDAEELEVEVERLRVNVSNLKANLNQATSQLQAALQDVSVEQEEKTRAMKSAQSFKDGCAQAIERQHAAEERLSVTLEETKQAKLHSDMLVQCYKQQLEDLKTTHHKKIASLTEQLENLQASVNNNPSAAAGGEQASNFMSGPSPVSEWAVHLPNPALPDADISIRLSSLQREEGEGSESVDSFPSRRISVTTQERRHELVPLDKLLSSPTYPEDDNGGVVRANSADLNVDLLQSKLGACESRASHLTALLSEAESDAARLSQLNAVLKEEIRRQQRCEERAQHAHNLEYLKNIVVKFITLQSGDERQQLVPVLNTILKLSPEEAGLVASVAKGASQANTNSRGWGSYLPLPGWTGS